MNVFHRLTLITSCLLLMTISISMVDAWFIPTQTTVTELAPGVFFRKTRNKPEFIGCNQGCCLLYTSPSPRDRQKSRMPSSA